MPLVFLWLQNQTFYKGLQQHVVDVVNTKSQVWCDVGCSVGLLTRLAYKKGHKVRGYDLNTTSLKIASFLNSDIVYKNENFLDFKDETFDVISATSLLSVLDEKEKAFSKLVSLLKNKDSVLLIIEPTEKLTLKNVWSKCTSLKSFWYYKGLLLWAYARQGKSISADVYTSVKNVKIEQVRLIDDMVEITKVQRSS